MKKHVWTKFIQNANKKSKEIDKDSKVIRKLRKNLHLFQKIYFYVGVFNILSNVYIVGLFSDTTII